MSASLQDHSHIQGWGADLDRANRPAVPMERMPPRLEGVHWDEPERQPQRVELLQTLERPDLPPVFGTSVPPSGLSGQMRRRAFGYTENDLRHWLMLIAADRVNVVEGRLEDMRNLPHERPVATTVLLVAGVAALALWMHRPRSADVDQWIEEPQPAPWD